jgi:hypothetical protein
LIAVVAAVRKELGGNSESEVLRQDASNTIKGLPNIRFELNGSVKASVQIPVKPGTFYTFNLCVDLPVADGAPRLAYFLAYPHYARQHAYLPIVERADMSELARIITHDLTLPVNEKPAD